MYFLRFSNLLVLGVKKIGKLQQAASQRAEDIFKMRLAELRRLTTRQNGGPGLPKELPRLSPKVTMDIGGTAFGRLRGGNSPNLEATWSPKQTQAGDCVLSQNIAKPMLFLGFGSFIGSGGSETREIAATDG